MTSSACADPSAPTGASPARASARRPRHRRRRGRHRTRAACAARSSSWWRAAGAGSDGSFVLVGAREPGQLVFGDDLAAWERGGSPCPRHRRPRPRRSGAAAWVSSRRCSTTRASIRRNCRALMCGPEIMMRFTARALVDLGVDPGVDLGVARAQHAVRARLVRALPARTPARCAATVPSCATAAMVAGLMNERER